MDDDHFDLARFELAQDSGGTYRAAVRELRAGRKTGHWMWFVFPQIAGLGQSPTARRFAIGSVSEARAYLEHPVLGARLRECATILAELPGSSAERNAAEGSAAEGSSAEGSAAEAIFGGIDAMKLRSSMTLFLRARPGERVFATVLERYFGGEADAATDRRLEASGVRPAGP